ncbi:MAG TPA: ATP-dependent protease ATPase subunit HslU [Abditibacteriaceae bacterium]|jgi:ATP-dependent HslUV protease ATP-binding subunit HslU|nr:ATP-dependent protease ATPase subunit HslU [Abditibacteriaceae bacterium]
MSENTETKIEPREDKAKLDLQKLTPRQIVEELDKYIVGQDAAKRAVAVALRNRYRRSQLPEEMREDVVPKNILMIGSTGVGKTEIARRLAHLAGAPMLKVEATKFTEVGYVGRDVDSMIRDLTEIGVSMVEKEKIEGVQEQARLLAEDRVLDLLVEKPKPRRRAQSAATRNPFEAMFGGEKETEEDDNSPTFQAQREQAERLRARMKEKLQNGEMEEAEVEIEIEEARQSRVIGPIGMGETGFDMQNALEGLIPKNRKKRKMKLPEARRVLQNEEAERLVDRDAVVSEALERVQQNGILFIDELDKVAGRENTSGPQVSREGVQRDILPIVEGSSVATKYGQVRTDHILFIAAGAFHVSKPSDLIPELQGRFPIRVELENLTEADFRRILTEPRNALLKQYSALLAADGVTVEFAPDGIDEIARLAQQVNEQTENIGARRLHTVVEKLLDEVSFAAPEVEDKRVLVDASYVRDRLGELVKNEDLSRYIL